jgi:hypothetical protein
MNDASRKSRQWGSKAKSSRSTRSRNGSPARRFHRAPAESAGRARATFRMPTLKRASNTTRESCVSIFCLSTSLFTQSCIARTTGLLPRSQVDSITRGLLAIRLRPMVRANSSIRLTYTGRPGPSSDQRLPTYSRTASRRLDRNRSRERRECSIAVASRGTSIARLLAVRVFIAHLLGWKRFHRPGEQIAVAQLLEVGRPHLAPPTQQCLQPVVLVGRIGERRQHLAAQRPHPGELLLQLVHPRRQRALADRNHLGSHLTPRG